MSFVDERSRMVERQLAARGIADERVLEAFREVPREAFVPAALVERAYEDLPLEIGEGQTISQPYVVAVTLAALQLSPRDRVLEVGTGSGYAAALLGRVAAEVRTIERLPSLAEQARQRLDRLGYKNVRVRCGDGTMGWPEAAPFQGIAVAAGGPELPRALLYQLAPGGRLVMPVGRDEASQVLVRVTREGQDAFREEPIVSVRFVPLIGEQGWPEPEGESEEAKHEPRKTGESDEVDAGDGAEGRGREDGPRDRRTDSGLHAPRERSRGGGQRMRDRVRDRVRELVRGAINKRAGR